MMLVDRFIRALERRVLKRIKFFRHAFAGDGIEKALVIEMVNNFAIKNIVETGTYNGKTALWFAEQFPRVKVYTIEIDVKYYNAAKSVLTQSNVKQYLGNSASLINEICRDTLANETTLFFLDAHGMNEGWDEPLPLRRELIAAFNREEPTIIIIDDFQVPGRSDIAFCVNEVQSSFSYPEEERLSLDNALNIDLIHDLLENNITGLYPDYTYSDLLKYQIDPLHANIVGYIVLFCNIPQLSLNKFLASDFVKENYKLLNK